MGTYVITEPCIGVKDGSCVDVCPVACIHTTSQAPQYYIDPDICIECEQCVIVCPVEAIFVLEEVPERWASFVDLNAQFFKELKPPTEPISPQTAAAIVAAAEDYGARSGLCLAVAVTDLSGAIVAAKVMEGAKDSDLEAAAEAARKAAANGARGPGARPLFERLEIVGGLGVAGASQEENGLAARAGAAAASDLLKQA